MKVSSFMTSDPVTCLARDDLDEAMHLMDGHDVRHLLVMDGRRLVGVLSERDLLAATGWRTRAERGGEDDRHVGSLVDRQFLHASPDDELPTVATRLLVWIVGCLPVLDGDEFVGIVTEADFLRAYAETLRGDPVLDAAAPTVASRMSTHLLTAEPGWGLEHAARLCRDQHVHHLLVVEDGRLRGIVSDRDLRRSAGSGDPASTTVAEIMTPRPATIAPERDTGAAAELMAEARVSALPVVRGEELLGILSISDLLLHATSLRGEAARSTATRGA